MNRRRSYQFILSVIVVLFTLFGIANVGKAQQTDTTQTTKELETQRKLIPYHSERSTNSYLLPESGSYEVPEPTEYYVPPFEGQKYLDIAVAAYREELENSIANTPLFQFINAIAPFVNNRFEFGVYRIYDLPIIERDNPYLHPQTGKKEQ